jgi:pimeloyl-ACP methyl ester carboxylesterase
MDLLAKNLPSLDSATAWTDQYYFRDWRIQKHVESGKCRLLDTDDNSQISGSFEECLTHLKQIKREQNLEPMRGTAVLLLHGLAAPRWSMKLLGRHLQKECGFYPFVVEYASTRSTIDDQAQGLANVIRSLDGIDTIHLVGHSMGNIVVRRYLAGDESPQSGWKPDARVGRIVMIAPPNHGSITATRLSDFTLFKKLLGESGRQLGKGWEDLEQRLAIPSGEFGIIAGGFGNRMGLSLTVPGDDDGRISVDTTRLAGARDFVVVSAVHEFIANDPRVLGMTRQFLTDGYFKTQQDRQQIPRDPVAKRRNNTTR